MLSPRRNPAGDSRYAFTALARGGWDGRWEDRRHDSHLPAAPAFRSRRGRPNRKEEQTDSRFDPRYSSAYEYEEQRGGGLPIPQFAPLPSYAGADDLSSVGGDSAYEGSQFGGSRVSMGTQQRQDNGRGPLGYYVGGGSSSGDYFSHDLRSQADAASVDSRRF